jgi:Raf kinase inhibitor-like YbhB/YbcL family protein
MQLWIQSFNEGESIPGEFAFAVVDPRNHFSMSTNRNPHLEWSDVPEGTRSFALICHDYDVPSQADDVNQEGREVSASLPRIDFFHWLLLDVPATTREIVAGSHSNGVTPRGKSGPATTGGLRHGVNDFTKWFLGDAKMEGKYHGYDGPAPPWNDAVVHHYVFTLYALDIQHPHVQGELTGPNVRAALEAHVRAKATLTGTYSLNPRLNTRGHAG